MLPVSMEKQSAHVSITKFGTEVKSQPLKDVVFFNIWFGYFLKVHPNFIAKPQSWIIQWLQYDSWNKYEI